MNLRVIYISSSQTVIPMLSVKNALHECCQNTMFYNYSTKKLTLLLKTTFQELFIMDYIFMLVDHIPTVYVKTSLNRFCETAVLAVT